VGHQHGPSGQPGRSYSPAVPDRVLLGGQQRLCEAAGVAHGHRESDAGQVDLNLRPKPGAEPSRPCNRGSRRLNRHGVDVAPGYINSLFSEKCVEPVRHNNKPTASDSDLTANLPVPTKEVHGGLKNNSLTNSEFQLWKPDSHV
jgi:hypothetical protein